MQVRSYWIAFGFVLMAEVGRYRWVFFRSRFFLLTTYLVVTVLFAGSLLLEIAPGALPGFQGVVTSVSARAGSLLNVEQTFFKREATGSGDTETIGTRLVTAQTVWDDYVMKNPFFGTGFGGELPLMSPLGGVVLMKYQIGNGYLTILAKFGMSVFLIYALVLWNLCRTLYWIAKSPSATEDEKLLARSFLAGIVAILIASFFSSVFIRQQPALLGFLFLIAETVVMQRNIQMRMRQNKLIIS